MNSLIVKAFGGLLFLTAMMAGALFFSAGTINYRQGWVFLVIFFISSLIITLYLVKYDQKLLERRVKGGPGSEKETNQKIIQSLSSVAFFSLMIIPALDHRFGWSAVPVYINEVGDTLVATGFYLVFLVFRKNTFTSATIEVSAGQITVSTGPYSIVRHPMYSGALILLLGVSPALGSWWGLLTLIPFAFILVSRLLDEEKFLQKNLDGYADYQRKVIYRLLPFIW